MSTPEIIAYACEVLRLALYVWGVTALAAVLVGYGLAALSGAGESGSKEDES